MAEYIAKSNSSMMADAPASNVPVLATRGTIIFPGSRLVFSVGREVSLAALEKAKEHGNWVLVLSQRDAEIIKPTADDFYRVGVLARILDVSEKDKRSEKNGRGVRVAIQGVSRFVVESLELRDKCFFASGAELQDKSDADEQTLQSLTTGLKQLAKEILEMLPVETGVIVEELEKVDDPVVLSHTVAQHIDLGAEEAQELLEMVSLKNRLLRLLELLVERREKLKVQQKISETMSDKLGKQQRDHLLREQMRAIQEELGEGEDGPTNDDYRKKIADAKMPEEAAKVALRELNRLERMGSQSAESHVIRNYLDLLCEMPWAETSGAEINLNTAEEVLHRDHYGLEKIKQRILEHLAVMKLRSEKRGSILLLVGPPGVGKTSLGKSIAEALGRKFVRASLGGVRDDADIRGHRRTYVGALPGRIVDGIRRAKAKDPVFILDEIDKLARGWGGDPASALLEVLDPEQNGAFYDHYLDVPFDLSQVFFIATANTKETIPAPLLDRMEVIDVSGYTSEEKFHIAKRHLLPAELEAHGLKAEQLELEDSALEQIIADYTREAGVRSLRRELAKVSRAAAAKLVRGNLEHVKISSVDVEEILGPARYESDVRDEQPHAGVVTGMAWTPVGGETLFVEAALVPGSGKIQVTGQLGDVMKESSKIAVSLAKKRLEGTVKAVQFSDRDIHVHVPAGAIPKDGPSAGVTMFTAVASMMLDKPVDPKLAMTGEITLSGKVLPVGGIKEKVLAAKRLGIDKIIMPQRNKKDVNEIPQNVRDSLNFCFVSDVGQLMEAVFDIKSEPPTLTGPANPGRPANSSCWHHRGQ